MSSLMLPRGVLELNLIGWFVSCDNLDPVTLIGQVLGMCAPLEGKSWPNLTTESQEGWLSQGNMSCQYYKMVEVILKFNLIDVY